MKRLNMAVTGVLVLAGVGGSLRAQTPAPQSAAPTPASVAQKTWADWVTFKGDLRYRYESINDDSKLDADKDTYTRERNRIRARLGAEAKANDNTKIGMELSTGGADPVSGNQSLGDGFSKDELRLSLGYIDYSVLGDSANELHAVAGKMKNPFITMADDLVWDSDLNPEGLAVKGEVPGDIVTLLANGGYLWVQERSDKEDLIQYGGQLAAKVEFMPEIVLTVGSSYFDSQNAEGYDVIDWENKNNAYGNSTVNGTTSGTATNKAWATGFAPIVCFAKLDVWTAGLPLSFYAQTLNNLDADAFELGYLLGASLGKAKNPKTWEVGYNYAEIEKDATLGMFTDSDRWGGGTDGKGHKFYGKYQLMKNLQAGIAYFLDERKISDASKTTDYDRLQVDLMATF